MARVQQVTLVNGPGLSQHNHSTHLETLPSPFCPLRHALHPEAQSGGGEIPHNVSVAGTESQVGEAPASQLPLSHKTTPLATSPVTSARVPV